MVWTVLYSLLKWDEFLPVESKLCVVIIVIIIIIIIIISNADNKIGINKRETFIMQMKKLLNKVCIANHYYY